MLLPSPEARQSSLNLQTLIAEEIGKHGNWIPFSRFMELVLYAPQYGYYTGGSHKIGNTGDFITAPTLTPLFAQTLARQLQELLPQTAGNIYEFGAGTGQLAADLLGSVSDSINCYYIIEISPELAARQKNLIQARAPEASQKVVHLTALPEAFDGIIIGNELLDAIPVEIVRKNEGGLLEHIGVCTDNGRFAYSARPLHDPSLSTSASLYFPQTDYPYTSELHPQQYAFIRTLASRLERGGMIFIDYGFDAAQYYPATQSRHIDRTLPTPRYPQSFRLHRVGRSDRPRQLYRHCPSRYGCRTGFDRLSAPVPFSAESGHNRTVGTDG